MKGNLQILTKYAHTYIFEDKYNMFLLTGRWLFLDVKFAFPNFKVNIIGLEPIKTSCLLEIFVENPGVRFITNVLKQYKILIRLIKSWFNIGIRCVCIENLQGIYYVPSSTLKKVTNK